MAKGNIVARFEFPHCTGEISDSEFAGKSEAEMNRIREEAKRLASRCYLNALKREMAPLISAGMDEARAQSIAEEALVRKVKEAEIRRNMVVWGTPEGGTPIIT